MGRRPATADELLAQDAANGYQRGAHREVDETCGREKHIGKTKKNHEGTLRPYVLYSYHGKQVAGSGHSLMWQVAPHCYERRIRPERPSAPPPPSSDEEDARCQYPRTGMAAPDLATVKDFLRFYASTSHLR